jgi:uncharacterized protein (TIGR02596 family)
MERMSRFDPSPVLSETMKSADERPNREVFCGKRRNFRRASGRRKGAATLRGFSLIELLVVVVIVMILAAVGTVAMQGVSAARNLTTAGSMVLDQISLAQQTALTRNTRSRWQIIEVPDLRTGEEKAWRLMRVQVFDPTNRAWQTVDRKLLPVSVNVDPSTNASTLLANPQPVDDLTYGGEQGVSALASSIVFRPDGRTSLNPNSICSLTLRNPRKANDFITVQIDPISGRTRTFRQ